MLDFRAHAFEINNRWPMKSFIVKAGSISLDGIVQENREKPAPGPGQILVEIKATCLNFRDLVIPLGKYLSGPLPENTVPLSDGAGKVVEVGPGVTRFKVDDAVCGTFFRHWIDGPPNPETGPALGYEVDGVLSEYVVFDQEDAVLAPANLNYAESATLPCAAVTAWNALLGAGKPIRPGDNVLLLGTGGVSMFGLLLAKAAGARVIITSSSDEKLEKAQALGADTGINYRTNENWEQEVLKVTGNRGVDCVVEVGGITTLPKSMSALARGGKICMIGFVGGMRGEANPQQVMRSGGNLHGIFVGNRAMFEQLNRAVEVNDLHPVIDKVFDFNDTVAAYRHLQSQSHVGKIVIQL